MEMQTDPLSSSVTRTERIACSVNALQGRLHDQSRRFLLPPDFDWNGVSAAIGNIVAALPQGAGTLVITYKSVQFEGDEWRGLERITHLIPNATTGPDVFISRHDGADTLRTQLDWRPRFIAAVKGAGDWDAQIAQWESMTPEIQAELQRYDPSLDDWWYERTFQHWYEMFTTSDDEVRAAMWEQLGNEERAGIRSRCRDVDDWADAQERATWNRQRYGDPTRPTPWVNPDEMREAAGRDMAISEVRDDDEENESDDDSSS